MRNQRTICLLLLAVGACCPALTVATPAGSAVPKISSPAAQMFAALTLDQAVALAERTYHARVVRADTQREGDRIIYVLRLLNAAGRVWTVRVDAQSGQMQ